MEAGHRCAIPTCKQTPVEIAHIIPYDNVLKHEFDNLITLCPNFHRRYDRGEFVIPIPNHPDLAVGPCNVAVYGHLHL